MSRVFLWIRNTDRHIFGKDDEKRGRNLSFILCVCVFGVTGTFHRSVRVVGPVAMPCQVREVVKRASCLEVVLHASPVRCMMRCWKVLSPLFHPLSRLGQRGQQEARRGVQVYKVHLQIPCCLDPTGLSCLLRVKLAWRRYRGHLAEAGYCVPGLSLLICHHATAPI